MMPPDMPEAPPPVFEIEKNTLTDRMYTLLRQTEVLSDSVLQIVSEVDKLINDGVVTEAQAVQVIAATQRGIQLVDAVAMVNERKLTLWEALARLEE
jgi:hypothetical protein